MHFDIPLCKIDEEKRLVIGQAAAEVLDKSGESMDYASAKAAFQEWSDGFHEMTNGASRGNLRVMHTKEVAGKIIDLTFDDVTKSVNIVAHVASDNAWNLCKSGCYGGFSIGGGYAKRWTDDATGLKKYTPIVREISLVDSPCIPTARFIELVKADGIIEQLQLHGVVRSFASQWAERPVGFAEAYANQPRTFGDLIDAMPLDGLGKAFSAAKHPRSAMGRWAPLAVVAAAAVPVALGFHALARNKPAGGSKQSLNQEWDDLGDKMTRAGMTPHRQTRNGITTEFRMHLARDVSVDGSPSGEVSVDFGPDKRRRVESDAPAAELAKFSSWSESKHPRGQRGKFSTARAQTKAVTMAEKAGEKLPRDHPLSGWAEGMAGASFVGAQALENGPKLAQGIKFGFGEKGLRNATAAYLRANPGTRDSVRTYARMARIKALEGFAKPEGGTDLDYAARRKVMEEATSRGSSIEEAKAAGDRFAEKLRGRRGSKTVGDLYWRGKPLKQVTPKAAAAATRAAHQDLRGSVIRLAHQIGHPGPIGGGGFKGTVRRMIASRIALGVPGAILGEQAAHRLAHEDEDLHVTPAHAIGATAGDALRTLSLGALGHSVGQAAGFLGNVAHQGFRSNWKSRMVDLPQANRGGKIGSRIGLALGVAASVPNLYREYSTRYGSGNT